MYKKQAPRQLKQRYYYIFWSIATISVLIGQIAVVKTYNRLSNNLESIIIEQARQKTSKTAF
tara:strand:- start:2634 stop:2819 length:186 start_codon:yes stop_codon:yes gene_type:complete